MQYSAHDIELELAPFTLRHTRLDPYDNLLLEHSAKIQVSNPATEKSVRLGEVRFSVLDVGQALNERESLFDVCDARSQRYYALHRALFRTGCELRSSVTRLADNPCELGVLYIEALSLRPQYRGAGLGRAVIATLVRSFSRGCGLVALQAAPLEYADEAQHRLGTAKLRAYYHKMGFRRLPSSGYMVLNPAYNTPGLED